MHKIHFRIRGVKRAAVHAAARWPTHHHRRRRVPEVMPLGHEIRELVERADDEVDKLQLRDRTQARIAHPASRSYDRALADRRIDHTLPAEPLDQSFACLKRSPINANVFAQQDHRWVALHLFKHRLLDGLEKRDLCSVRGRFSHAHPRPFLAADTATGFTDFFEGDFAAGDFAALAFTTGLDPFDFVVAAALVVSVSNEGFVSPKWIGAFAPPELFPDPNPSTVQTA